MIAKKIVVLLITTISFFGCKKGKECFECPVSILKDVEIMLLMDNGLSEMSGNYIMFCSQKKKLLFNYNNMQGKVSIFPEEISGYDIPVKYPVVISGEVYSIENGYDMHISEVERVCACNENLRVGEFNLGFFLCKDSVPKVLGSNEPTLANAIVIPSDISENLTFDISWKTRGIVCSYPANIRDLLGKDPVAVIVKGYTYFNDVLPTKDILYPVDIEITSIQVKDSDCYLAGPGPGSESKTKKGTIKFKTHLENCDDFLIYIEGKYYYPEFLCDKFKRNGLQINISYEETGDSITCLSFGKYTPIIRVMNLEIDK